MPIFRQRNELEGVKFERGDLFYNEDDPRRCTESVFVHFTNGDISIHTAARRSGISDEILLIDNREPHTIGETSDKFNGYPTHAPVVLVFDAVASVDAMIASLNELKIAMGDSKEGEGTGSKN